MFLYTHFSLGLDTLRLGLRSLPNGPTAPELEADPAVGVAHDLQGEVSLPHQAGLTYHHGQEVGEDHEAHIVPAGHTITSCTKPLEIDTNI